MTTVDTIIALTIHEEATNLSHIYREALCAVGALGVVHGEEAAEVVAL